MSVSCFIDCQHTHVVTLYIEMPVIWDVFVIFQDKNVGILDADVYGPSIPRMMNIKGPVYVNDSEEHFICNFNS